MLLSKTFPAESTVSWPRLSAETLKALEGFAARILPRPPLPAGERFGEGAHIEPLRSATGDTRSRGLLLNESKNVRRLRAALGGPGLGGAAPLPPLGLRLAHYLGDFGLPDLTVGLDEPHLPPLHTEEKAEELLGKVLAELIDEKLRQGALVPARVEFGEDCVICHLGFNWKWLGLEGLTLKVLLVVEMLGI